MVNGQLQTVNHKRSTGSAEPPDPRTFHSQFTLPRAALAIDSKQTEDTPTPPQPAALPIRCPHQRIYPKNSSDPLGPGPAAAAAGPGPAAAADWPERPLSPGRALMADRIVVRNFV